MTRARLGARGLEALEDSLSGRDHAIIRQIADLRLMSGKQIEAVHFTLDEHASTVSAARTARRVLERLVRDRLIVRLARRVGGVRAGSGSFVYAIGPVGERIIGSAGARRRFREPSTTFALHTLAISEVVVDVVTASRLGRFDLLSVQPEPHCWRQLPGLANLVLRPDLFLSVGAGEFELRWFIEIDLGTEHLPTLLRKAAVYQSYFQSGIEQAEHGVFPRVLWLMHSADRVRRLREAIDAAPRLTPELFIVATRDELIDTLTGGKP